MILALAAMALAVADGTPPIDSKWALRQAPAPLNAAREDWTRLPAYDDMKSYYPDRAQREGMNGRAVIDCVVTVDGHLDNCKTVSEAPPDYGFGDAALKLAHLFKMKPTTADGTPVGGARITIPIRFVAPAGPTAPVAPTAEPTGQGPGSIPEE